MTVRRQICFHSVTNYPLLFNLSENQRDMMPPTKPNCVETSDFALVAKHGPELQRKMCVGCSTFSRAKRILTVKWFCWLCLVTPGGYLNTTGCDVIYLVTPVKCILTHFILTSFSSA